MTILSVAYPLFPVGPDSAGGAEQILYLLERGIVASGHRSIVVAAAGSRISGILIETSIPKGELTDQARRTVQGAHASHIQSALRQYPIDLVHFHGLDFDTYIPKDSVPMLATLHLPPDWYSSCVFQESRVGLNCVSETQARSIPHAAAHSTKPPVICNGIDIGCYGQTSGKKEFLLILGRICPEKGIHVALEVAHRLDLPLIVAGPVHPFRDHQRYFSERVEPLLDEKRIYAGQVGLQEKVELLARAHCLLAPSSAPETSSLVAMEAIASGTAVIAFRSGALPEIVENGETGFVVDSADQMAEAIRRLREISSAKCRARARLRFDVSRMTAEYLNLYGNLIANAGSNPCASR